MSAGVTTGGSASETAPAAAPDQVPRSRQPGDQPGDQPGGRPGWARLVLLAIAAIAAFSYAWRSAAPVNIEIYYSAAVRSMSVNLHDFLFGAFDPAGTVSVDKLPGALWMQAVSVSIFGAHRWALVLPQIVEGAATVLVLYRAVRRLAGWPAGLLAAGILAISPATVALNRGNISDTLMILLLVLAADATVTVVLTGRLRSAPLVGVWVGLAFQAKMIEAWLALPAIGLACLIAAPGSWRRRALRIGALGIVATAVSLSWMAAVTLVPPSARPYADGSQNDSVFHQVFVYNGFRRVDQASPDQLLNHSIRLGLPASPAPGWDRLLTGSLGRDTGWLVIAAVIALAVGLIARRREPRSDPVRVCLLFWGTWLLALASAFSATTLINSYYTAALSPAIAALIGTGLAIAWQHRRRARSRIVVALAAAVTAGYSAWLLPTVGVGLPTWLKPALAVLATAALTSLAGLIWPKSRERFWPVTMTLSVLAVFLAPAVASASVVSSGLGPFQTPFEPPRVNAGITGFLSVGFRIGPVLPALEKANSGFPDLMATQTSVLAAPFIWATGQEVLPIGGFTGTIPEPSLATLRSLIKMNDVRTFVQSPTATDPRLIWIARYCIHVPNAPGAVNVLPISAYYCPPVSFP
jgi:4-amino-4-deoxy-L-arabinose transferase-like glycosyltransferase